MTAIGRVLALTGLTLALGAVAGAEDPYETGGGNNDDQCPAFNSLEHGANQRHDLESTGGIPDQDWAWIFDRSYHSYEVQVRNPPVLLPNTLFTRVRCNGALLGTSSHLDDQQGLTLRWIGGENEVVWLRLMGPQVLIGADVVYDLLMFDTTYAIPRFNNSGTQTTLLLVQNVRSAPVNGRIDFFDSAGSHLAMLPVAVPAHGLAVLATAMDPALAGRSGSARIAHDGGYGALAGKAVALEPATGFVFETSIVPLPY